MRNSIIFTLFVIILAGCSPIGYIGDASTLNPDDFWTVPLRLVYDEGSDFVRTEDLSVWSISRGLTQRIDVRQVQIRLIKNPDGDRNDPNNRVNLNSITTLTKSLVGVGRKIISVTYQGLTDEYSIEIQDLTGNLGSEEEEGFQVGSGGGFIVWRP